MDCYSELGIRSDASDAEVKRAYYALVKKYHPDKFANSPLKEDAQERLKRINIAYDEIQRLRKGASTSNGAPYGGAYRRPGGGSSPFGGGSPFGAGSPFGGAQGGFGSEGTYTRSSSGNPSYNRVRQLLNARMLDQAEALLESMQNRDAEWYYLRGLCYFQRGWYDQASQLFTHAVSLDPNNTEYRQAVERMEAINNGYRQPFAGVYKNASPQMGLCGLCMCLQCMGGICGNSYCC